MTPPAGEGNMGAGGAGAGAATSSHAGAGAGGAGAGAATSSRAGAGAGAPVASCETEGPIGSPSGRFSFATSNFADAHGKTAMWETTQGALGRAADSEPLALLVDTNVWVDAFIDRSVNHEAAALFLKRARLAHVPIFASLEATRDMSFLVSAELKRMQRDEKGTVTQQFANAVNEASWSLLQTMRRTATVVGADSSDMVEALALRAKHADYEDNLVMAAALRCRATHIVSSDKQLQAHSPIPCISIAEALALLDGK